MLLVKINETEFYAIGYATETSVVTISRYNTNGLILTTKGITVTPLHSLVRASMLGSGLLLMGTLLSPEYQMPIPIFLRFGDDFALLWQKPYSAVSVGSELQSGFIITKRGTAVFAGADAALGRYFNLLEISAEGEVVWSKSITTSYLSLLVESEASDNITYISNTEWGFDVHSIDSERSDSLVLSLNGTTVNYALELRHGEGLALVGRCGTTRMLCLVKVGKNSTWKLDVGEMGVGQVFETKQGDLVAIGGFNGGAIFSLSSTGASKWKRHCPEPRDIIELKEREYVYTGYMYLEKFSIPTHVELHRCDFIDQCGGCSLGYYWNYTACRPCPRGCGVCVTEDFCESCTSLYRKDLYKPNTCVRRPQNQTTRKSNNNGSVTSGTKT